MKTVTLGVSTIENSKRRLGRALKGRRQGAFITFESPQLSWKTLTEKRRDDLRAMAGAGPMSIREAARRVDRDVKAVHGDVRALLAAGVLDRTGDGLVMFPFDAVHVDFRLTAAA